MGYKVNNPAFLVAFVRLYQICKSAGIVPVIINTMKQFLTVMVAWSLSQLQLIGVIFSFVGSSE